MQKDDLSGQEAYKNWLGELKEKIARTQQKTVMAVNAALIQFYWDLGKDIAEKQASSQWGDKIVEQIAVDLRKAFPNLKGLSASNLKYCKRFYLFYTTTAIGQQPVDQLQKQDRTIGQQAVDQIPWGHNILIFTKSKNRKEAEFYIAHTIKNGWSRNVLALQIKTDLYGRQGKSVTNFALTLPEPQSELEQQTIKDPYVFDFMGLGESFKERDIEIQLINNVTKFLLELDKGFAFMGKQYQLEIANQDYYLDLLFYHVNLKCYVVIELKNTKFLPEYAGKLNFYLSAVDDVLKEKDDHPTIGILLCRDKNNVEVEYALRGMSQPMGVSEFILTQSLTDKLKSNLPTIEEIEQELEE
ncbi:PDDEXK nuclease domain-containing protein [Flavobacteriaceae bacterium F89]|uniref:PDDEXK nuclease domain-containing protein n=1 Tax=Cerina litoralis TaxID=2874477 RepID=A0AAE3JSS8_9FLAO|nr:PDDEXK nuclease domain-containing protein [Cerina litoralis]MCG2460832.1 PDDEXK nuclease domain-containing protein [Cerina litoralis]